MDNWLVSHCGRLGICSLGNLDFRLAGSACTKSGWCWGHFDIVTRSRIESHTDANGLTFIHTIAFAQSHANIDQYAVSNSNKHSESNKYQNKNAPACPKPDFPPDHRAPHSRPSASSTEFSARAGSTSHRSIGESRPRWKLLGQYPGQWHNSILNLQWRDVCFERFFFIYM